MDKIRFIISNKTANPHLQNTKLKISSFVYKHYNRKANKKYISDKKYTNQLLLQNFLYRQWTGA